MSQPENEEKFARLRMSFAIRIINERQCVDDLSIISFSLNSFVVRKCVDVYLFSLLLLLFLFFTWMLLLLSFELCSIHKRACSVVFHRSNPKRSNRRFVHKMTLASAAVTYTVLMYIEFCNEDHLLLKMLNEYTHYSYFFVSMFRTGCAQYRSAVLVKDMHQQ